MIALTRLFLMDVYIDTIPEHRAKYLLYDNKPCVDDNADKCKDCLTRRVMSIGDRVGWKENGDSKHFFKRQKNNKA